MPRKNRGKFKPVNNNRSPSNSSSVVIRNPFTLEGSDVSDTLKYLKEAFEGKVDGDAIFTIFSACDFNVNETIEALFSISNEESSQDDLQRSVIRNAQSAASEDSRECLEPQETSLHLPERYSKKSAVDKRNSYENYSDLSQRLFSLSLEDSSVRGNPNVNSSENKSEILYHANSEETQYHCEALHTGNNILNQNFIVSLNSDAKQNPSAAIGVISKQQYNSWHPSSSCSYDVPSCSPLVRNAACSCPEKESKIFFPHLSPHVEKLDQNTVPVFYNQYKASSSFNHTESPPKFITPLIPSQRPKGKVINYIPFKNKVPETPVSLQKVGPLGTDPQRETMIRQIIDKVIVNCKVLVILRGLPGSGKSTLALKLQQSGVIYSTDDFFYKRGKYCFKWAKLSEAHEWNRRRTKRAMEKGITPVIIDNTNVERWEIKPYIALGLQFNYDIHILEPDTPWKFKPGELAKRNRHKVPKDKIERMLERYEHNITVESVVESSQDPITSGSSGLEEISLCDVGENANFISDINYAEKMQQEDLLCGRQHIGELEKEFLQQDNGILQLTGENSVLLEAVVHREDETLSSHSGIYDSIEHSSSSCDISAHELCSNNSVSSEIAAPLGDVGSDSGQNGSTEGLDEIQNCMCLKDLIILTEQGNEECQTSSNQMSPSCSSHDSSNWEVVTNQEDDFTWTSVPQIEFQEVKQLDITYSVETITDKSEMQANTGVVKEQTGSEIDKKVYVSLDLNKSCGNSISEDKSENAEEFHDWGLEVGCTFGPKPQRETPSLPQRKTCLSNYPTSSNLFKKHRACNEWGSMAEEKENNSWNDDSASSYPKSEKSVASVLPKPQRNLMSTMGISTNEISSHKNLKRWDTPQSNLLETVPEYEEPSEEIRPSGVLSPNTGRKRKYNGFLRNLSPTCTARVEWEFPDFVLDPPSLPVIVETPQNYNTTCSTTQTEPQDFIFLHESSNSNVQNKDFKVLSPSSLDKQLNRSHRIIVEDFSDIPVPKFARFDKSTSTSDMSESVETHEKLCILQDCFPDIQYEDLKAHLETFQGDSEWLTNTLLDWGYKYNICSEFGVSVSSKCELEKICVPQTSPVKENSNLMLLSENSTVPGVISEDNSSEIFSVHDYFKADLFTSGNDFDSCVAGTGSITGCDTAFNDSSYNNTLSSKEPDTKHDSQNSLSASQTLQLRLDPAFVSELEGHFGSIPQDTSSGDAHVIEIDMNLAREIYKRLCENSQKSTTSESAKSGNEELLDEADGDLCNISEVRSRNFNRRVREQQPETGEISFAEIMDHEYALHISEKERLQSQKRKTTVSTRLKRDKLYKTFPGIDRSAIDAVFEANRFSLRNTMIALEADVGKTPALLSDVDCDLYDLSTEGSSTTLSATEPIIQDFFLENWSDWVEPREKMEETSSTGLDSFSLNAASLREEAVHHHALHRQYMESAQNAYHDGKKPVAAYYRQKSQYHLGKFKELNKEAVQIIVEENRLKNPSPLVLDLHGLYVSEAIHVLEKFIKSKRTEYFHSTETDDLNISVITGHGSRSANGPKLRSSVAEYLKSKGFRFDYVNSGMFSITAGQK